MSSSSRANPSSLESDLNEAASLDLQFMILEGASDAEKNILHSMLFKTPSQEILFSALKRPNGDTITDPPTSGQELIGLSAEIEHSSTVSGTKAETIVEEGDGRQNQPGYNDNDSVSAENPQHENGTVVVTSIPGMMMDQQAMNTWSGGAPAHIRGYYPYYQGPIHVPYSTFQQIQPGQYIGPPPPGSFIPGHPYMFPAPYPQPPHAYPGPYPQQPHVATTQPQQVDTTSFPEPPADLSSLPEPPVDVSSLPDPPVEVSSLPEPSVDASSFPEPPVDSSSFPEAPVVEVARTSQSQPTAPSGRTWASIASSRTNGLSAHASETKIGSNSGTGDNGDGVYNQTTTNHVPSLHSPTSESILDDSSYQSLEDDPVAYQLGEYLATLQLNHHSLSLTPRGLSNQSNFCYINAILQSLIACPPVVNMFRGMDRIIGRNPCKSAPINQNVFEFFMEFEPITRLNQNNKTKGPQDAFYVGANFEPTGIRKVLGLLDGATFKVEGRQEDAEEFLSHVLNGLHDEMTKLIKFYHAKNEKYNIKTNGLPKSKPGPAKPQQNPVSSNGESADSVGEGEDDEWQVMGPKKRGTMTRKTEFTKTPISELFLGQYSSLLNRGVGNIPKTTTLQPFFTLQLDIQDENIRSVRDALDGLSTKEELSVTSSVNGQETAMWKQLSLETLPMILVVHLKRFVYDKSSNKIYKVTKRVDFGIDLEIGKDLLSLTCKSKISQNKQRLYKLFSVVYHDGEDAHKGHYIADTFHPSGGCLWGQFGWIRYDDTSVKGITEHQILNPQPPRVPYLLFYRRVDTVSQSKKVQDRDRERERN